jgi:deazaflavin-dependent oxidoreductase (nitroreductase family)
MPNIRWLLRTITVVHRFLLQVSGGRIGARMAGMDMLLLENVGRKSGTRRVTPLLFAENEGRYLVVASNAGDDRNPAWWLNLQARPEAAVRVRGKRVPVKARAASSEEEADLWPVLDASYRYYPEYRARAKRSIPIVILSPTGTTP